jgi:hypothetical protein
MVSIFKVFIQSSDDRSNEYLRHLYSKILNDQIGLKIQNQSLSRSEIPIDRDSFEKYSIFSRNEVYTCLISLHDKK